jgi:hypothetical protein
MLPPRPDRIWTGKEHFVGEWMWLPCWIAAYWLSNNQKEIIIDLSSCPRRGVALQTRVFRSSNEGPATQAGPSSILLQLLSFIHP